MKALFNRRNKDNRNLLKYGSRITLCCVIMVIGVALLMAQSAKTTAKDQKAAEAMAVAIKAMGGEKNIDGIKSLILTGTSKYPQSGVESKVEIKILLPDNYIKIIERQPQVLKISTYFAFSKGEYKNAGFVGKDRSSMLPIDFKDEFNRFACLMMGMLLKSDPVAPLTISSVAGTTNRFSIEKTTGVLGEIEFDPKEKYPTLISFKDVVVLPPRPVQDPVTKNVYSIRGETEVVNNITRFKDRVDVDGVMFPKTIVFESRGIEEIYIEKVQINPKLTLKDFEIPQEP